VVEFCNCNEEGDAWKSEKMGGTFTHSNDENMLWFNAMNSLSP
jgi:hypothetical protein